MGKRELVALLNLSSWCLVMVKWLFLSVPWDCLHFVIVVFPDHTHLLIKNRYNQVPYLTQDTTWESDKHTIKITYKRAKENDKSLINIIVYI